MERLNAAWLGTLVSAVALGGLADSSFAAETLLRGEQLDPSTYGPSVVETLEEALARDAARPPQWMVDPKGRNNQPGTGVIPAEGLQPPPIPANIMPSTSGVIPGWESPFPRGHP